MVRLNLFELCLVRIDHLPDALAQRERLRRGKCWLRLHEYGDEVRAVLLGEYAGVLQNARSLALPIYKDHDIPEISSALIRARGRRLNLYTPTRRFSHKNFSS